MAGAWLIQARRFASQSSTRQTNSLNSDKKVNLKPSETGCSPLNRLANRPVILCTAAYFEFLCLFFLPSVFVCVLFRAAFPCAVLFYCRKNHFAVLFEYDFTPWKHQKSTQNLLQPIHAFSLSRHKTVCNCYGQSDTNFKPTNHEKDKTTARQQSKKADKTWIFAKEKPKSNTFVFDLGFEWRKEWDSLREIISFHLFSLGSSYTSLIFIISLSLSRRGCKQPFRLFGRLAFVVVYCIVCKPTSNPFESHFINVKTKRTGKNLPVRFVWRKLRDSNHCAFWANGFQVSNAELCLFISFDL